MKIQVTQKDISLANKRRRAGMNWPLSQNCPVALAMKRITHRKSIVGISAVYYGDKLIKFPEKVEEKISNWEQGKRMYPFSFEI